MRFNDSRTGNTNFGGFFTVNRFLSPLSHKKYGVFLQRMTQKEAFDDLKELSVSDTFDKLSASAGGLTPEEAEKRLEKYGYNEIAEKKVNPVLKLFSYFWGPIP